MRLATETGLRLSVVIAASNGAGSLQLCLASLKRQAAARDTEIIVVSNYSDGVEEMVKQQFPYVKYIGLADNTTVPELRTKGIACSRGEVVALLEDHCTFDERWCEQIKEAHQSAYPVVGGSIENASQNRALDWAVYFYDYGRYMPPNQAGWAGALSGNNVSYKRCVLEEVADSFREGFFEAFIHEELKSHGHDLYMMPSAIVYHQKSYELKSALTQCYHLARSYAGRRIAKAPLRKRAVFVCGSMALPVLLPLRIAARILRKRRHRRELLMSLPHLVLLMTSWSIGEFRGYLCGEGASGRRWK